jgi:CBS-domain-containing membrane protein
MSLRQFVHPLATVDAHGSAIGIVTADDLLVDLGRRLAEVTGAIENPADATESR